MSNLESESDYGSEIPPPKTLVLVGKTGNGKSATGNSIIGRHVFDSMPSFAGVTSTCQMQTTVLDDGQVLDVIDTPGLFDPCVERLDIAKEIARCIGMAKDGIHAVVIVVSIRNRFSLEKMEAFKGLRQIFGPKIVDYMIVVFAHGDALGVNESLDHFLYYCPDILRSALEMCGNRHILFDNVTTDEVKISRQREELLSLVNAVVDNNGGMPYTNDLFDEVKKGGLNPIDQNEEDACSEAMFNDLYGKGLERFTEMVESRMRESILRLDKQLAEERSARLEAEGKALEARMKAIDEMREVDERLKVSENKNKKMGESLKVSEKKNKEMENKIQNTHNCYIL